MLDIQAAIKKILECSTSGVPGRLATEDLSITEALGRVLAEPIQSQLDVPPHDKAMMDGYAFRHQDWVSGKALKVIGRLTAGQTPPQQVTTDSAIQIMTGAMIPPGADCVVMFEQCKELAAIGERYDRNSGPELPTFVSTEHPPRSQQNILARGRIMKESDELVPRGRRLTGCDIGLAADSGNHRVRVYRRPKIAVLATGDELTPAGEPLIPGSVYNSNGPMASALAAECGADVIDLGIGCDDRDILSSLIDEGLKCDVLLLSGGVSAGVLDLVPALLRDAGVEEVFHKVPIKPGKPIWFGVRKRAGGDNEAPASDTLVFGLPGNPVSALVCFRLFVAIAIHARGGAALPDREESVAELEQAFEQRGDRQTYWPARTTWKSGKLIINALPWRGSADLKTMASANALAIFPAGERKFEAGEKIGFVELDRF